MNISWEPLKNWFGFTRRERRSTFILLLIVVLILVIKYLIPDSQISIKDITGDVLQAENLSELTARDNIFTRQLSSSDSMKNYHDTSRKVSRSNFRSIHMESSKGRGDNFKKRLPVSQKQLMDINLSDSAALIALPGIGPVLSSRIIKYRHLLGGFARISQLKEVYGLPAETFDMIKDLVSADSAVVTRIDINSAGYLELSHIHYFEKYEITAILKYRELKGRITSLGDLTENKLISEEKAFMVRPYLRFE
jgi:DNA uptake protein ComE-like DNA-binding protein